MLWWVAWRTASFTGKFRQSHKLIVWAVIFIIIGTGKIGIGKLGMLDGGYLSAEITTNASILADLLYNLTTNAYVSEDAIYSILTNAYISVQTLSSLTTNASITEIVSESLTTNASIAADIEYSLTTNANIISLNYWALGPAGSLIGLSGLVYDPDSTGFGLKTTKLRIPGARNVRLLDYGIEGGSRTFIIVFQTDAERQAFQEVVNNDSENLLLYTGRSDRYQMVKKVSVEPEYDELWRGIAALKVTCEMEDPYHYHESDQGVDLGSCTLPQAGTSKYNYGSVMSPILFTIGGVYYGGQQLAAPYVACMDGATEEKSLCLGPGLLSKEYAELTLEGSWKYYLTHTYADDYANNNYWQYDAVQSGGCSLSGGQVSIPSEGWFYYKFQGYPTKDPIRLVATITKTGTPLIQYSTDGSIWTTSITAAEIRSGVKKTYNLTDTEKRGTVYVRFYCPTGSTMVVQGVDFYMERDISSQHEEIPMVPVGENRALNVTGSGSGRALIKDVFRARWQPQ